MVSGIKHLHRFCLAVDDLLLRLVILVPVELDEFGFGFPSLFVRVPICAPDMVAGPKPLHIAVMDRGDKWGWG